MAGKSSPPKMQAQAQRTSIGTRIFLFVLSASVATALYVRPPDSPWASLLIVGLLAAFVSTIAYTIRAQKSRAVAVENREPNWDHCDLLRARSLMTLEIMITESKAGRKYVEFDQRPPADAADAAWRAFEMRPTPATARVLIRHSPSTEDVFRHCVVSDVNNNALQDAVTPDGVPAWRASQKSAHWNCRER